MTSRGFADPEKREFQEWLQRAHPRFASRARPADSPIYDFTEDNRLYRQFKQATRPAAQPAPPAVAPVEQLTPMPTPSVSGISKQPGEAIAPADVMTEA